MSGHRLGSRGGAIVGLWVAALSGCGGAAPAPAAAPTPAGMAPEPTPAPASSEEAAAELDRAEMEIARALGAPRDKFDAAPTTPAPPPPPAASARPSPEMKPSERAAPSEPSADPCETACRALASMRRAAQHLCGLAGPSDQRCEGAETRVKNASAKVLAQCPACAAG